MKWFKRKPKTLFEFELSGQVVGESRYRETIEAIVSLEPSALANPEGGEVFAVAKLVAEVNPHDRTAVAVKYGRHHIGYLPRGEIDRSAWGALRTEGGLDVDVRIGWGPRRRYGVTILGVAK